jgi:hypothetical protein
MPVDPQLMHALLGGNYVQGIDPVELQQSYLSLAANKAAVARQQKNDAALDAYRANPSGGELGQLATTNPQVAGVLSQMAERQAQERNRIRDDEANRADKLRTEQLTAVKEREAANDALAKADRTRHGAAFAALHAAPTRETLDALLAQGDLKPEEHEEFAALPPDKWKTTARAGMAHNMTQAEIDKHDTDQAALATHAQTLKTAEATQADKDEAKAQKKAALDAYFAARPNIPRNAASEMQAWAAVSAKPDQAVSETDLATRAADPNASAADRKAATDALSLLTRQKQAGRAVTNVNTPASLDREFKAAATPFEKKSAAAADHLAKIQDAKALLMGGPEGQAAGIPKALSALVGGQGSGLRMTEAEIKRLENARGIIGGMKGAVRGALGMGRLSDGQVQEFVKILDAAADEHGAALKSANDALEELSAASTRDGINAAANKHRRKAEGGATGKPEIIIHSVE